MNNYAWKSVWGRRGKLVMTLAAVVLAVAFVCGAQLFTGHLNAQYTNLAVGRLPDLVVAADGALDPDRRDAKTITYSETDIARLRALDGVSAAEGRLATSALTFDHADGTSATQGVIPLSALGWTQFPMTTSEPAFTISRGHAPGPGEVVFDQLTFDAAGYRIGDRVEMSFFADDQTTTREFELVGVADWSAGATGSKSVWLDYAELYGLVGDRACDQIWVQLDPDADPSQVADAVERVLPGSAALDAASAATLQGDSQADSMGYLKPLLLVFAGVSVLVACFMISNTFGILVVQRTRELALLRALGASGSQVRRIVIVEALVTGVIGSLLGVLAGWGLALGLLRAMGGGTTISPSVPVVASSLAIGMLVTVLAGLLPARRASRIAPVVAMRGQTAASSRPVQVNPDQLPKFSHPVGRLARLNLTRQPGRTVGAGVSLLIGCFLVGMMGVFGASAKASIAEMMPDVMGSDFIVMAESITTERMDAIEALPGVASVHPHGIIGASIDDLQTAVQVTEPADYSTVIAQTITQGRVAERAFELVVVEQVADQHGWQVGDEVAGVVDGEPVTWQLVGLFSYPDNISSTEFVTPPATLDALGLDNQVNTLGVRAHADADVSAVKQELGGQLKLIPGSTLLDVEEYTKAVGAQIDTMVNAIFGLVGLSVLIAVLGIINTLGLSVLERTHELGLLRAVGLTRGQVRGLVVRESLLLSVLGGGSGVLLGVFAGIGMQLANRSSLVRLAIPGTQLAAVLVVIVLAGLLASLAPAHRAARTDILVAVAA